MLISDAYTSFKIIFKKRGLGQGVVKRHLAVGTLADSTPLASCSLEFTNVFKAKKCRDLLMALQLQALLLSGSHLVSKKGTVGATFKAFRHVSVPHAAPLPSR